MELVDTDGPEAVPPPTPLVTSDVVERALRDAERLIAGEGATSGLIRTLYKIIREQHPAFQQARLQQTELDKILRSLAAIVEALNPLRNQASVAHPNAELLEEPEPMLAINSVRALMHYINARTND